MQFFLMLSRLRTEQVLQAIRSEGHILQLRMRSMYNESLNAENVTMSVFGLNCHGKFHYLLGKGKILSLNGSYWIVIVGTPDEPVEVSQKITAFPLNPGQEMNQVFHYIDNNIRKMIEPTS